MRPNTKSEIIDIYLASITSRRITHKSHLSALKLYQSADRSEKKLIKYLETKIKNGAIQVKEEDA